MAAWPATLPCQPLAGSLSFTPEPNVAEFKPDVGAPIRRRRYTAIRLLYQAEMKMTATEVAQLMQFFSTDCEDGALTFTMTDWRTGATETFSWISPPSFQRIAGNIWSVTLPLALEP
jgi:hypothetical protein